MNIDICSFTVSKLISLDHRIESAVALNSYLNGALNLQRMEFARKSTIGICRKPNLPKKKFARNGISKERERVGGICKKWTLQKMRMPIA